MSTVPFPPSLPHASARPGPTGRLADTNLPRTVAAMRALLAVICGAGLLLLGQRLVPLSPTVQAALVAYAGWSVTLWVLVVRETPHAGSTLWLWLDAALLLTGYVLSRDGFWLLGMLCVLPIVAVAASAGVAQAAALALVTLGAFVASGGPLRGGVWDWADLAVMALVALAPGAAWLARPGRGLRERLQMQERLARTDPRQGLQHHVDVLLGLLCTRYQAAGATISLQGPEPRVFARSAETPAAVLGEEEADRWRSRFAALPQDAGCLRAADHTAAHAIDGSRRVPLDDAARAALLTLPAHSLALPLRSYGQPLGHLCLQRDGEPFVAADLVFVRRVLREALPLLERSDLLEQLQRETAARERERIGRDLHDSAVQPYLGLKYGLEALRLRAGTGNALAPHIDQLVALAAEELLTLRGVVSGLRRGADLPEADATLAALQRQTQRFEALFGLRVNVFAPPELHLRGAAARAVLHMVNEALTNVRRHTSATAVTVMLDLDGSHVQLRLRNDHGEGEPLPPDFVPSSLSERTTEMGGTLALTHEANFTEVLIRLPLVGRAAP